MRKKISFWTKDQKSIEEFYPTLLKTCFVCRNRAKFEIEDRYGKFTLCETHFEDFVDASLPQKARKSRPLIGRFSEQAGEDIFSILEKLSPKELKNLKEKIDAEQISQVASCCS